MHNNMSKIITHWSPKPTRIYFMARSLGHCNWM